MWATTALRSSPWRQAGVGFASSWSIGTPNAWVGMSVNRGPDCGPGAHFPRSEGYCRLIPICQQTAFFVGGDLCVPPEGAHLGAPLRFVCKFLTATQYKWRRTLAGACPSRQTNGVAERIIRTLKEQVIYGRVFQNLQEVQERSDALWTPATASGWWKKRLSQPLAGQTPVVRPGLNRKGGLRRTCVQKT